MKNLSKSYSDDNIIFVEIKLDYVNVLIRNNEIGLAK